MDSFRDYLTLAFSAGCPPDQTERFLHARCILQERQLAASAAARLCDLPDGPTEIGYGGARGGGKSHWMVAQIGLDDCQRMPGLKALMLRKVGKSNLEALGDLRLKLFRNVKHTFSPSRGTLTFPNGSRMVVKHFQNENDIDTHIGLEYDVIGIEEATTLSATKYKNIGTCNRTSKVLPDGTMWRPRVYSTTNPGGIGHVWYRKLFVLPFQGHAESETRFIPATVADNNFLNVGYVKKLEAQTGWQREAWLHGSWEIAAGQFFSTFRRDVHVIKKFDERCATEWFAAMDYGFSHYTVVLLGCRDGDGNTYIVDEHAERSWIVQQNASAIHAMMKRHGIALNAADYEAALASGGCHSLDGKVPAGYLPMVYPRGYQAKRLQRLARFVAGADVFSNRHDGTTIDQQYRRLGISMRPATMDRINGWAEILGLLGDPDRGIAPRLFIHERCGRLLECLPYLQHDPNRPDDVLKVNPDEDGLGGDDSADALRYLIATKPRIVHAMNLGS
jgi:phage terminase large subunit